MIWRSIPTFRDRYEVSDAGLVRKVEGHVLSPQPTHNGYLRVYLRRADGSGSWQRVHTLVLEAFVGPRPSPRHHGAHGPGGQKDNSLANLRWALPEDNERDKRIAGTVRGGGHGKSPTPCVDQIRRAAEEGESYSSIAARLGMHRYSVSRICRGLRRARTA